MLMTERIILRLYKRGFLNMKEVEKEAEYIICR